MFKFLGIAMILWGIADWIIDFRGGDLWLTIGLTLPDLADKYSPYIALVSGLILFFVFGSRRTPKRI